MQALYCKDDSKLIITLIDGAFYFLNNKTPTKSFFKSVNENVPLTALKWKSNKDFLIGDTEGNIFWYEYLKEDNSIQERAKITDPSEE